MCDGRGGEASCARPLETISNGPPSKVSNNATVVTPMRIGRMGVLLAPKCAPRLRRTGPLFDDDRAHHVGMKLTVVGKLAGGGEGVTEARARRNGSGLEHVTNIGCGGVRHLILIRPGDGV